MCGIAGFHGIGQREDIQRMTDALIHRGPDGGGIFIDADLALGHRRLSILDIAGGAQPMRDTQSGAIIVYNGELYNHPQLRQELESLGHIFQTSHSDTETCLHAFLQWGPDCFCRFNGMFACAIYLPAKKELWLARDRFGEKPLFYIQNSAGFAFASELAALRLWPGFEPGYVPHELQRFFSWNYMPGGRAIYKNCHSLQPGTWMRLDLASNQASTLSYWQFELTPDDSLTESHEPELVEELRSLLIQAVKRRMLSDVPLGIFLSGGLDSSAVLAAACKISEPEQLRSFTIGFEEKSFDESAKARLVAQSLGVRNDLAILTEQTMRDSIVSILTRMSEPFGDASLIPTWHLAAFARKHVTVALSGDGGDELFAGYDPLAALAPAAIYRWGMPAFVHKVLRKFLARIPASDRNMSLDFKLKRVLRGLSYPAAIQLPIWMSGLEPEEIAEFFHDPLPADELFADALELYKRHSRLDALSQALLFFTCIYLPDDILVKTDRAAMQVSLETRAVFLDNDLVAFCQRLPNNFKFRNGQRKYLLRKALEGWLPPEILDYPKKGFGIPLNLWLRSLPAPKVHLPDLKDGVIEHCEALHRRRKGDFRFFLWDLQSISALQAAA